MKRILPILILVFISFGLSAQKKDAPKQKIVKQFTLSPDFAEEITLPFDTVFSLCHRYRLSDKYSPLNATLGNYGLPFYQINFFDRINDPDEFIYSYYYPFMYLPGKTVFMNTQVPFTELVWTFGAPRETSEQTFRIRHSQNITRYLNFGLIYDIIYSLGQYNYQRAENKDFIFYTSYTSPKYKLYFAAGINNLTSHENGGIKDSVQLNLYKTRDVPINLGGLNLATSRIKNRNILLVQRFTIGGQSAKGDSTKKKHNGFLGLSGTFSHIFIWEKNSRSYKDNYPESGFYDSIYINKVQTYDSLYSRSLKNTVRFDFTTDETRKFRLGGGFGIRNELFRYSQIVPTHDTNYADTVAWNKYNNALVGRLYNDIGKFSWRANGELYLTGYRAGDFSLTGQISKTFGWKKGDATWAVTGGIINRQPSFWYEQWGGNNFEWHNNFKKEFRIDLGTIFSFPARKTELKFNYAIIDNFIDFGTNALPSQHEGGLSVAAISAKKEFRAWKFHLATDILLQRSSNPGILDLPLFTTQSALYFEHLFRFRKTGGKLNVQFGADAIYHTHYYAYSYMPATGRFYRQDKTRTGEYPFMNVFLNLKLKRTRIFLMYDHVLSGLVGYDYYMVPTYPLNYRMIRYGIAWTFYN